MKKTVIIIAIVLAAAVFLFSGYQVFSYYFEVAKSNRVTNALAKEFVTFIEPQTVPSKTEPDETGQGTGNTEPSEPGAKETAPLTVDFEALHQENDEVVAWIYCADTSINYPVAQSEDNQYYLHRMVNRQYSAAGTLFLDCRNLPDFSDWNSVIYGHNRYSGDMFGSIVKYKSQEYYEAHPYLYLLTADASYKVELVAGYTTVSDERIYNIAGVDEDRDAILSNALSKSTFRTSAEFQPEDRFVTLSTCAYDFQDARYVLIGRLVLLAEQP